MKRTRAVAIVVDRERVLLLWRKKNGNTYFVFPGGGKEEGETIEEAVVREAMEETSIKVKVEKYLYKITDETTESYFYLCSYISGEPQLGNGNEIQKRNELNQYEPMWKDILEVANLNLLPQTIKEWFIESHKNKFAGYPREITVVIKSTSKE